MRRLRITLGVVVIAGCALAVFELTEVLGRGGRGGGGGGGRGGGGRSFSGGGGGGRSIGSGGPINRSPGVSVPQINRPSAGRPSVQPKGGGGLGARDGPGNMTLPKLSPGNRPTIGSKGVDPGFGKGGVGGRPGIGDRPGIGSKGVDPGFGKGGLGDRPGIGSKGVDPGFGKGGIGGGTGVGGKGGVGGPGGNRPSVLPGIGLGAASGLVAAKGGEPILGRRQDRIENRKENLGNRSQNLQDRLDQRQEFRQQAQDQRQESLENRREDWQNWHDDYHGHHDGWYHGAWCDNWGDGWSHMWSEHTAAMVLGTTMWGLNRMGYWFGTAGYENPYYAESSGPVVVDSTTISYGEPLVAAPPETSAEAAAQPSQLPPGVMPEGMSHFEASRTAFYQGSYQKALDEANKALASMPKDALIHEFRALVLFALGNYRDAAATLHPVLAVGPGWDWTTMSSLYPDSEIYTKQLRALEGVVTANQKAADARFVLAYHYLTLGHNDSAARHLSKLRELLPNDTVTPQLLQMLGKSATAAAPAPESTVKVDAGGLLGTWTAKRGGKADFELTLDKDKGFTWVYREGKKREQVKGAYALDGNVLALEPDAGGVMLAEISTPQNGSFDFRTVAAPTTDKGLRFQKK